MPMMTSNNTEQCENIRTLSHKLSALDIALNCGNSSSQSSSNKFDSNRNSIMPNRKVSARISSTLIQDDSRVFPEMTDSHYQQEHGAKDCVYPSKLDTNNVEDLEDEDTIDEQNENRVQITNVTVLSSPRSSQMTKKNENAHEDDDMDSISTMSEGSHEERKGTRSIFKCHWEKNSIPRVRKSSISTCETTDSTTLSTFTSARSLPAHLSGPNSIQRMHVLSKCTYETTHHHLHRSPKEVIYQEYGEASRKSSSGGASMVKKESDVYVYEQYIKEYETGKTTVPQAAMLKDGKESEAEITTKASATTPHNNNNNNANRRRSLFAKNNYQSLPSLPSYRYSDNAISSETSNPFSSPYTNSNIIQKAFSSSALLSARRKRPSILRTRSYSLSDPDGSTRSTNNVSVTFDPKVSIHEYDRPHDLSASEGWSKWFI